MGEIERDAVRRPGVTGLKSWRAANAVMVPRRFSFARCVRRGCIAMIGRGETGGERTTATAPAAVRRSVCGIACRALDCGVRRYGSGGARPTRRRRRVVNGMSRPPQCGHRGAVRSLPASIGSAATGALAAVSWSGSVGARPRGSVVAGRGPSNSGARRSRVLTCAGASRP